MTDIHIPPEVVEAGARAYELAARSLRGNPLEAAILAALNVWPGMIEAHHPRDNQHAIILPTNTSTKETDNG